MSYEWLKDYNRADVALPSGIGVTLSLVRAQEAMVVGMPHGVLGEMQKLAEAAEKAETNGDGPKEPEPSPELSPETIAAGQLYLKEMVRRTLRRVAPSLEELDGPDDDDVPIWVVDKFDQADFDALVGYAMRTTPLPAGSQA